MVFLLAHIRLVCFNILTKLLLAGVSVEFQFAEVVGVLLSSPGSSHPLIHVQLLQLFWLHFFPHTHEAIPGHLGQRTVLPEAARLETETELLFILSLATRITLYYTMC